MIVKTSFLESNIQLFKARYKKEHQRLADCLKDYVLTDEPPQAAMTAEQCIVPKFDVIPYPKLVIMNSISHPSSTKSILSQEHLNEVKVLVILENDPSQVAWLFHTQDLAPWFLNPAIHFLIGYGLEEMHDYCYRIFGDHFTRRYIDPGVVIHHPKAAREMPEYCNQIQNMYQDMKHMFLKNLGYIDDYMEGVRATVVNEKFYRDPAVGGLQELEGTFAGKNLPAVIVGAGPSLDDDLEQLKKIQDKVVIFAADAAVKPLINAGVRVDFATSIERWLDIQTEFWSGLDPAKLPDLLVLPVVHTRVLDEYQGPLRLVNRNYTYYATYQKLFNHGLIHSFSSASHMALRCAHFMGCTEFWLVGCDSSFKKIGENRYDSHSRDMAIKEGTSVGLTADELAATSDPVFLPFKPVQTNDGKETLAHVYHLKWSEEFSKEIYVLSLEDRFFNASRTGAVIRRAEHRPLVSLVSEVEDSRKLILAARATKLASRPERVKNAAGKLDRLPVHLSALRRQLKAMRSKLVDLQAYSGVAKDSQSYIVIDQWINTFLGRDLFFHGWVSQLCTLEIAAVDNHLYRLSFNPANDTKDQWTLRLQLLLSKFDIWIQTLDKVVKILDTKGVVELTREEQEKVITQHGKQIL